MKQYTMTRDETAQWESDGPGGQTARTDTRDKAAQCAVDAGAPSVEILSCEGIVMDWIEVNTEGQRWC